MKISSGNPEKAQPHHGLLILGIGAVIASLFSSLPEGFLSFSSGKTEHDGDCVYQLFIEDVSQGIVALKGPVTIEVIARAFGCDDRAKGDRRIPCGTTVRIKHEPPGYSLEKISGSSLIMAGRRIDINRADAADLQAVPGIGPVLAERIFEYRREHGPFRKVEDLAGIGGISRKRVQALEPYLWAGSSRSDTLQNVKTVGCFVDPTIRGHQKESARCNEIGKSDAGGY